MVECILDDRLQCAVASSHVASAWPCLGRERCALTETRPAEGGVQSVHWALDVLEALAAAGGTASLSDLAAARLGAGAVKVFPASVVGPGHISALRPVFPEMQLVATGGVDADNARDFIAAGVSAVAFGSSIAGVITVRD
jgi:thiamine monophosphate synthase